LDDVKAQIVERLGELRRNAGPVAHMREKVSSAASLSPFTTASTSAKLSAWRSPTRNAGPATGRADAAQPSPTQPRLWCSVL
jgi:hypothetical protein